MSTPFQHLENHFPNIQEQLLAYGKQCYSYGIDVGLSPAQQVMIWLTMEPPMDAKYLREMLQKEIDSELKKKDQNIMK